MLGPSIKAFLTFGAWLLVKQGIAMLAMGAPPSLMALVAGPAFLLLLLTAALLPFPFRLWRVAWMTTAVLLTALLSADIVRVRTVGRPVVLSAMFYASQLIDIPDAVVAVLRPSDLLWWVDLPVAMFLLFRRRPARRHDYISFRTAAALGTVSLAVALGCGWVAGWSRVSHS